MTHDIPKIMRRILQLLALLIAILTVTGTAQAAPCATNCLKPGDYRIVTLSGGLPRSYLIHVPVSYTGNTAVPLLLDLHGFTSYGADERKYSGQLQQSDQRGFIAVWPDGIALSWNAYGCCAAGDAANVDDVGFLRSVIVAMKGRANIDDTRVFVTGISNGGGMAQRMACEAADLVRAVASVSFPLNTNTCRPAKPIGVTEIAATGDATISYYGGSSSLPPLPDDTAGVPLGVQGARESLAEWKQIDHCSDDLTRTQLLPDVRVEEYRTCDGGVRHGLVTVIGGKHVLYSNYVGLGYTGDYVAPIDVASYIWQNVFNL
ncbi:alpha/beta hydrolase family esterase [Sphingomonas sp. GB1N7]|uniref:alpha/beta hydrolase family esterase n=1 Tax=Parasphingomonas caseinilytica TaxID=3096158 RepID=UPI002FC58DBC